MTIEDSRFIQDKIYDALNSPEYRDEPDMGYCWTLAIIDTLRMQIPRDPEIVRGLVVGTIRAYGDSAHDKNAMESATKVARLFWPNLKVEGIEARSSKDPLVSEILKTAHRDKRPVIFNIKGVEEDSTHAVAVRFIKTRNQGLVAEMVYGFPRVRPRIAVTDKGPVILRDLFGVAEDFFREEREVVVLPPEYQISFEQYLHKKNREE